MIGNAEQCNAEKANGDACTHTPVPTLDVCHSHLDQSEVLKKADATDDRPVWERQSDDELRGGA